MYGFKSSWIYYTVITTVCWGIWGALIEIPEKNGFPATLGYLAWVVTMVPCALIALKIAKWRLDSDIKSVVQGCFIGFSGAGGQLVLFHALKEGPAYIIFPVVSLYPILTVLLSVLILHEKAKNRQYIGIALALIAIFLLSLSNQAQHENKGMLWLLLSIIVFILWGSQGFMMKFSNERMQAESIFFFMTLTGILLSPIAYLMTDFTEAVNYSLTGGRAAIAIHLLNSIGALTLVYALRYGKAIIVVPLTGLSPAITIIISLMLYGVFPNVTLTVGLILSLVSIYLLSE